MKINILAGFFGIFFGKPINTVTNIDLKMYTGKWHQVATSPFTSVHF